MKKFFLLFFISLFLSNTTASAQVVNSPITQDYATSAGAVIQHPITLKNTTNKPLVLDISVRDFISKPTTNEPQYLEQPNIDHGISLWWLDNNISPTITVPAQQSVTYLARFQIPSDVDKRSHYGGVFFTDLDNNPAISVVSIVFIDIGQPKSNLNFLDVSLQKSTAFGKAINNLNLTIQNNATGRATNLKNAWRIELVHNSAVLQTILADGDTFILPDSTKQFSYEVPNSLPEFGDITIAVYEQTSDEKMVLSKTIYQPAETKELVETKEETETRQPNRLFITIIIGLLGLSFIVTLASWRRRRLHK